MELNKRCRRVAIATLSLIILVVLAGSASAQKTDEVDAAFARATQLHQSGDLEGAVQGYQAILTTHPMRVDVRSNLGAALSGLGRYEEAIDQYKRALALIPENDAIRFNLAMAYYKGA